MFSIKIRIKLIRLKYVKNKLMFWYVFKFTTFGVLNRRELYFLK